MSLLVCVAARIHRKQNHGSLGEAVGTLHERETQRWTSSAPCQTIACPVSLGLDMNGSYLGPRLVTKSNTEIKLHEYSN